MDLGYPAIPERFPAGDALTWGRSLSAYPAADGWALCYALSTPTTKVDVLDGTDGVTITDAGTGSWTVTVPAAATAAWGAGDYVWKEFVQKALGVDRKTLNEGRIKVLPDIADAAADLRSPARKMLDALEALATGKATKDQLSYSIAGRSVTRLNPDELIRWTDYYRNQVRQEEARARTARGAPGQRIALARFV